MMFNLAAFSLYDLAFIIIAGITVTAALGVVLFKNIIYSALSLILAFLGAAAIYFQLNSSFLGVIQILVYAGAIYFSISSRTASDLVSRYRRFRLLITPS